MIDENLVKPFIEQYDFVREYIAEKERIVIGTIRQVLKSRRILCLDFGTALWSLLSISRCLA